MVWNKQLLVWESIILASPPSVRNPLNLWSRKASLPFSLFSIFPGGNFRVGFTRYSSQRDQKERSNIYLGIFFGLNCFDALQSDCFWVAKFLPFVLASQDRGACRSGILRFAVVPDFAVKLSQIKKPHKTILSQILRLRTRPRNKH